MKAYLIIGFNIDLTSYNFNDGVVVGIDRGALIAFQNGIKLDYAIGDFDSISADELKELSKYTKIFQLNPIKDVTDTEYAIMMFKDYDEIYLLGGIAGNRIDHFYANIKLFYKYPNLHLVDNYTHILQCDMNETFLKDEYTYYSFFALEEVHGLCLEGFKYPLHDYLLSCDSSLGVSNEMNLNEAKVSFSKGKLLLIKTKKEEF